MAPIVHAPCALPPSPVLPIVELRLGGEDGCPDAFAICLDGQNAAALEMRQARLERFARQARAACEQPDLVDLPLADGGHRD